MNENETTSTLEVEIFEETVEEQIEQVVEELPDSAEAATVDPPTPVPLPDAYELLCAQERAAREYDEFCSLFPKMTLSELPDSVRDSVREGVPLLAAAALYELRRLRADEAAAAANAANSELSFTLEKGGVTDVFFSPEEVREMSPSEVRTNYKKIIESMNHWN